MSDYTDRLAAELVRMQNLATDIDNAIEDSAFQQGAAFADDAQAKAELILLGIPLAVAFLLLFGIKVGYDEIREAVEQARDL